MELPVQVVSVEHQELLDSVVRAELVDTQELVVPVDNKD